MSKTLTTKQKFQVAGLVTGIGLLTLAFVGGSYFLLVKLIKFAWGA